MGPFHYFEIPDPNLIEGLVAPYVHRMLHKGSSWGTAFPSSHVAYSVVIWLMAWRHQRFMFWVYLFLVPALTLGAVYGGFHYAIDALAGTILAVIIYQVTKRVFPGLQS